MKHYVILEINDTPVLVPLKEYTRAHFPNEVSKYSNPNTHTLREILEKKGFKSIVTQGKNIIYYK